MNEVEKARKKAAEQTDMHFYKHKYPKTCSTCKHFGKMITEEPCFICDKEYNKWEKI